jgi:tetratricopeptide (TPR) repeat protein
MIFAELGDFESAEDSLRGALVAAERMGLTDLATSALQSLGRVLAQRGRLAEARVLEQRAAEAFHRIGDTRSEGVSRRYLAEIALASADPTVAEREARAAAELLTSTPLSRAAALATLARVLLAAGQTEAALCAAQEAIGALPETNEGDEEELLVHFVHAKALAANGNHEECRLAAARAKGILLTRATRISDPAWRERFMSAVPLHAETRALSAEAGGR